MSYAEKIVILLNEVTPPGKGMEKLVKELKKDPDVDSPWAIAWSVYNKRKKKRKNKSQ